MDDEPARLQSIKGAARLLNQTPGLVRKALKEGEIRTVHWAGRDWIPPAEITRLRKLLYGGDMPPCKTNGPAPKKIDRRRKPGALARQVIAYVGEHGPVRSGRIFEGLDTRNHVIYTVLRTLVREGALIKDADRSYRIARSET
jgi:hypothetical protein